jgi:hypothetical protein
VRTCVGFDRNTSEVPDVCLNCVVHLCASIRYCIAFAVKSPFVLTVTLLVCTVTVEQAVVSRVQNCIQSIKLYTEYKIVYRVHNCVPYFHILLLLLLLLLKHLHVSFADYHLGKGTD